MPQLKRSLIALACAPRKGAKAAGGTAAPAAAPAATALVEPPRLRELIAATNDPARGFLAMPEVEATALAAAGFAVVHPEWKDEQGNRAVKSEQKGVDLIAAIEAAKAQAAAAPAPVAAPASPFGASASAAFGTAPFTAAPAPAPVAAAPVAVAASTPTGFAIAANVPVPAGGVFGKKASYPFEALQVGQSFFVPATTDRPNPKKSMASTVASANGRYTRNTGTEQAPLYVHDRQFVLRGPVDGEAWGQKGVTGAAVWRTA